MKTTDQEQIDYGVLAIEFIVAIRGRLSRRRFSERLKYGSNIVQRWESGDCLPKAGRFLDACGGLINLERSYLEFFQRPPPWPSGTATSLALWEFLKELGAGMRISEMSARSGVNRFTISRWLRRQAEPNLAELFCMIEVTSGRLTDFVSTLVDPLKLPSLEKRWRKLELSRSLAYENPWGHAVLRALRLDAYGEVSAEETAAWVSERLSIPVGEINKLLIVLETMGWLRPQGQRLEPVPVPSLNTGRNDPAAAQLKIHWTKVAHDRLLSESSASFGYSLFEVSRTDFSTLRSLHLEYVKSMQRVADESTATDTVGLYCAQLLDLSGSS